MIYTASFFYPQHHHGRRISITQETPYQYVKVHGTLSPLLAPSEQLMEDWVYDAFTGELQFTDRYRSELKTKWGRCKKWLYSLDPKVDITLLGYPAPGRFCHRNLVFSMIQRHRPDCAGLQDSPDRVNPL